MATTDLGLPYPAITDAPNGPVQIGDLAKAVDARLKPLTEQTWTGYTPLWTASGVNPVINSLGKISGRYQQTGKRVHCVGRISMGTNTSWGTGLWYVTLPVQARWDSDVQFQMLSPGAAYCFDNSDTGNRFGAIALIADPNKLMFVTSNGAGNVSQNIPFIWATSDHLDWSITYEAA
ncbi:hypothetical protein GCM10010435_44520 [Winogradskya consettensis]|uniref:Uncharacterized protein n=1 Tax=Winogradskya consettensis TaxID=113560 RepID=A0A919T010_9ACTN|nr:hypothetical protein [Actinoplanes consettensis]GIM82716.1 hypothetical protein Aco04nite_82910 [Actinoplanes consettensis]